MDASKRTIDYSTLHSLLKKLPCRDVPLMDKNCNRAHGRDEIRCLKTAAVPGLPFTHTYQAPQNVRRRRDLPTGEITLERLYELTYLTMHHRRPRLQLGEHWGVEALHYLRDVTLREGASKIHTGSAPRITASLRNTAIALTDLVGWRSLAAAADHYWAHPVHALGPD